MSVSSDEINYLIWRYLQEAGHELSAYALQRETSVDKLDDKFSEHISPGALVSIIQKGIRYMEVEASIDENGEVVTEEKQTHTLFGALQSEQKMLENGSAGKSDNSTSIDDRTDQSKTLQPNTNNRVPQTQQPNNTLEHLRAGDSDKMDIDQDTTMPTRDAVVETQLVSSPLPLKNLTKVYETRKVETAQWSPKARNIVATAENDLTAKVLTFDPNDYSKTSNVVTLKHTGEDGVDKSITALAWDSTGNLLVSASFDGQLRLWTAEGKLRLILSLHRAPVLIIRWNKPNTMIMSVDCTNTVVIWDAYNGKVRQTFQHSPPPTDSADVMSIGTDADWIDSLTYACTGDNSSIMIYKISERGHQLKFRGHTQGINTIQFEPKTQFLASGSDDHSVRVWHGKSLNSVFTFLGHTGPIVWISWVPQAKSVITDLDPVGAGSPRLISASLDGTLRLWDTYRNACLKVLSLHEESIFACDLSRDGRFVASGGMDGVLVVWDIGNVKEGDDKEYAVARFELLEGDSDEQINSISWNDDGTKIFVGFSSKSVVVNFDIDHARDA